MNRRLERRWQLVVIVMCLLVLWPLLARGYFTSDDGEWMVIRLSAFYQSLAEGQFPVRFLGRLNYSYGYPVSNFLYPGFLYIGSFLHVLGFSFVNSVKIILSASVVGAALFLFASLRKYVSPIASFVGTFSFITAPYLAFDIYKRGSVGEILAIFAATMIMWSIETGSAIIFPAAVALLVVSHNSLALMFVCFYSIYLILTKRFVWFVYLILGVAISAFFWIPAIVERNLVRFSLVAISSPREYFVGLNNFDLIGLPFIAGLVMYLFMRRRVSGASYGRPVYIGGFIAGLFLASPWSGFLWDTRLFSSLFQFPFRFLALTLLCGPWIVASSVEYLRSVRPKLVGLFLVLGLVSLIPLFNSVHFVDREVGYYTTNEATTTVADEYMPRWAGALPKERNSNRIEIFQGKGTIEPRIINTQRIDANLIIEDDSTVQINTVYYPGWGVMVDNYPVPIDYDTDRGLMRVTVPKGTHELVAEFRETPLRFAADTITVASLVIYFLIVGRSLIVKTRKK